MERIGAWVEISPVAALKADRVLYDAG